MPLPNTRVIPPGWETHHAPVAEGTFTGTGTIARHSSNGTWDDAAGRTLYPDPVPVYTGPVRVQRDAQGEAVQRVGEREVTVLAYTVSLPADAPEIRVRDQVTVTGVTDTLLAGQVLWVHAVRYGSLIWERDLSCRNYPPTSR